MAAMLHVHSGDLVLPQRSLGGIQGTRPRWDAPGSPLARLASVGKPLKRTTLVAEAAGTVEGCPACTAFRLETAQPLATGSAAAIAIVRVATVISFHPGRCKSAKSRTVGHVGGRAWADAFVLTRENSVKRTDGASGTDRAACSPLFSFHMSRVHHASKRLPPYPQPEPT